MPALTAKRCSGGESNGVSGEGDGMASSDSESAVKSMASSGSCFCLLGSGAVREGLKSLLGIRSDGDSLSIEFIVILNAFQRFVKMKEFFR